MKHYIIMLLCTAVLVTFTSCNNNKEVNAKLDKIVSEIPVEPIYKIYPTRNMWNFLKLDTRNGKVTAVQYTVNDNEKQFEYTISDQALVQNNKPGRFILQPTENIYNFIMLDQVSGQTYQVQWSFDEDKRFVIPIK